MKIRSLHPTNLLRTLLLASCAMLLATCAENPVTGKRELTLVSTGQEIDIGEENYRPSQQSQGGQYSVDKELSVYVNAVGQKLARVSDRPDLPYEFVVLNNSVPNAWALPGGKIAVNRGLLLELNNEAELAAVLGHEIVHAAARHGAKSMERGILINVGIVGLGTSLGNDNNADLIVGAAALGAGLINQKYSRDAELESDRYGMKYMVKAGYNPEAAVALQETFVRLSEGRKSNWLEGLFASHPPSQERVKANQKYAAQLGTKGTLGAEEYQARIAHLKQTKPAYDAYDKGMKALGEKKPDEALKRADEAIAIEPREAQFYSLQGDAWQAKKEPKKAEASYSAALARNPDYFLPYLQRGLVRSELGDDNGAREDLAASATRLPTATAYLGLGDLAAKRRDNKQAIEYYRKASDSETATGKQAMGKLAKLDLARNPGNYLQLQTGLSPRGRVLVRVTNPTPLAVTRVAVRVGFVNLSGRVIASDDVEFTSAIPAGKFLDMESALTPPASGNATLQAVITQAEVLD